MHWVAWYGQEEIAELLILNGVEINASDNRQAIPLYLAYYKDQKDVTTRLVVLAAVLLPLLMLSSAHFKSYVLTVIVLFVLFVTMILAKLSQKFEVDQCWNYVGK